MEYFVYVLKSLKNGSFYKGMTTNLELRITQHNKGLTKSNKAFKPFELVFVQICENSIDARLLEKYLKSGYGREIIQEFVQ